MEEYISRMAAMDDTKNLPKEFFENVYCSIRDKEIKIPEEHPEAEISGKLSHILA